MGDHVPTKSNPDWKNWTEDIVHKAVPSGEYYYFSPRSRPELQEIVRLAAAEGVQVRVSGQRHSQPPLVIDDVRNDPPYRSRTWLLDLSCYADLGPNGDEQIVVDPEKRLVTVNAGVREDYLDAFLTTQNLILKTVTAGGFFSIGGMTAVDVHGATIGAPIFSETAVAFSVMGADGEVTVIDEQTTGIEGWNAIQFARVSLGALGIVTSITIEVFERPFATTLTSRIERVKLDSERAFVEKYLQLLADHPRPESFRIESFLNPYSNEFLLLEWSLQDPPPDDRKPNTKHIDVPTACAFASRDSHGAPYENAVEEWFADHAIDAVQYLKRDELPKLAIDFAYDAIEKMFASAQNKHTDLWLTEAARTSFISYFIELPKLDAAGFARVWQALQKVREQLRASNEFMVAGPMEFRFIKGGDSALSGAHSTGDDVYFANLDVIGFVGKTASSEYPKALQDFLAAIERSWYGDYKGIPHNGKMYGFYDPGAAGDESTPPFNPGFMQDLARRRGDCLTAFNAYRQQRDPDGLFCNDYLRALGIGVEVSSRYC